jgi:hypothetical protein
LANFSRKTLARVEAGVVCGVAEVRGSTNPASISPDSTPAESCATSNRERHVTTLRNSRETSLVEVREG